MLGVARGEIQRVVDDGEAAGNGVAGSRVNVAHQDGPGARSIRAPQFDAGSPIMRGEIDVSAHACQRARIGATRSRPDVAELVRGSYQWRLVRQLIEPPQ